MLLELSFWSVYLSGLPRVGSLWKFVLIFVTVLVKLSDFDLVSAAGATPIGYGPSLLLESKAKFDSWLNRGLLQLSR